MSSHRETLLARLLLIAVLIVNAVGLSPELTISRVDLNDNALHYPLVEGMVQSAEQGHNPLDWWAPEWTLGYPVLRTYQPLAHGIVALAYFALGKTVSLMTVFVWVRFLSVLLLPLSFFACARLLGFSQLTAAAAAMLSPLISTNALFGLEYGSYLWAGSGLFTQAVATHFLLLAIGFGFGAVRRGRLVALTGALVGLTFLAHFIYGYMAGLTICLLAVLPDPESPFWARIRRTISIAAIAVLLAGFELLPLALDSSIINRSRWEYTWKWDSFGAGQVLKWLFTGQLLDHGRLPVLSLLALGGLLVFFLDLRRTRHAWPARTFVLSGAALWILLFFGRSFWGPVLSLLAISPSLQLHRVIGGAQIFLVLLAAIGLAGLWRFITKQTDFAIAAAATALLFFPMVRERAQYLINNSNWGHRSLAAYEQSRPSIDRAISLAEQRGGRAYAGLAASWGARFKIGDPPFYAYLSEAQVPTVGFLFHSMSLTSDIMVRFNEWNPAHYSLFNVRTVIAPVENAPPLPDFLTPIERTGPLQIMQAPGAGYFDVVDAPFAVHTTKDDFFDVNDRWLASDWVAKKQYLFLDLRGDAPAGMSRLSPDDSLPALPAASPPGSIQRERQDGETYQADASVARPGFVLFKMTWHPGWKAYVDGKLQKTVMLSPGFVGVPAGIGQHHIVMQYEPEAWKTLLAVVGFLGTLLLVIGERRNALEPVKSRFVRFSERWRVPAMGAGTLAAAQRLLKLRPRLLIAAGLLILALPVVIPLLTSKVPEGHDAFEYLPRLVEFHQNISHGILLPRWAPDLSRGAGQPLFLFNPPAFYYLAELWHLLGQDYVRSINLACVVLVLAAALSMFLLGNLYFGSAGGFLAAAAYLYAPYFAVDLYVRSAWAEFAAFPFLVLSMFGFGAFAKNRHRGYLFLGAAAYAGVMLSHSAVALLFSPLLASFVAFTAWREKSWRILRHQIYGILLGLGLSAFAWLPALVEGQYTQARILLQGYLNYSNHFVYLHQLWYSPWGFGLSLPGDQDGMSFSLGWSHLLLAAAAWILVAHFRRKGERSLMLFFLCAAAILCYLTLNHSAWLWERIPILQYADFPWRFLGPAAVCLALLIAPLGPMLLSLRRWQAAAFAAVIALLIIPNLPHLAAKQFHDVDLFFWTPKQIAARGILAATNDAFRPKWSQSISAFEPESARAVSGNAKVQAVRVTPVSWSAVAKAGSRAEIELPIAYFPGWTVRVDGRLVEAGPGEGSGLIRFALPAGDHGVEAEWNRTKPCWTGDSISALSFLALMLAAFAPVLRRSRRREFLTPAQAH